MTEKTLNAIELGVTTVLSIGVDYAVDKTIKKLVNPQSVPEKILTGIGSLGVSCAANYGMYKIVHGVLHPNEEQRYEALVKEVEEVVKVDTEVAVTMAEIECRVENKVDEIFKQIMEGRVNG